MQPRHPPNYQLPYRATSVQPVFGMAMPQPFGMPQNVMVPRMPQAGYQPQTIPQEVAPTENKPTPSSKITLYIGHLSKEFDDQFVEQILNYCGGVKSWKRAKYSFGFAEFTFPEGALRARKVLDGLKIKDATLIVNVDDEVRKRLDDFEEGLKKGIHRLRPSNKMENTTLSMKHQLRKRNDRAVESINKLVVSKGWVMKAPPALSRSRSPSTKKEPKREKEKRSNESRSRKRRRRSRSRDRSRKKQKTEKTREKSDNGPRTQKELVKLVPKDPEKTLDYKVDWELVQKHRLAETKMRTWVELRLKEYMGGTEDADLTNFVVGLMVEKNDPRKIISELEVVLVEDSKRFVVKMWRRLIFESLKIKHKLV